MSSAKDDEDYWNSSDKNSFSFDQNNEVDNLFGVSKSGTAQLREGISNIKVSTAYFQQEDTRPNLKPLLSIISEQTLNIILTADKIFLPEEPSVVQPDITLRRILLGQPFSLEKYKSLVSKTALLDAALASGDGNAILIVILFIGKTLKWPLVERILLERPDSIPVYVRYLATRLQVNEITDLLTAQGRRVDAAITHFDIIIRNTRDASRLVEKLEKCYKTHFIDLPDCKESAFLNNYTKLLRWQMALENRQVDEVFNLNSPVLDCLRYACKDHYNSPMGALASPKMLLKEHDISARQYQKVALKMRASLQEWNDIDNLLLSKSWLGTPKLEASLSIDEILKTLSENQAPLTTIEKFLKYVDSAERRSELARTYNCSASTT
ncbi:spermatogenesis-defective protein 39 homolog [Venturia canescens]|uniref:spermatogenesis-defective protein 39 homolog n=1 Tax=Venturia canescens TaxID=32260 RepID=UPI001C9CCBF4|nr:spermatogenesis-defective protein 39 homolog [Venturia canescens]